jgi:organic hydroperoxide reductase OsmC/OhrA
MTKVHRYAVTNRWTGNLGPGTSAYTAYGADAGIVVSEYSDEAEGEMIEHPDGSGEFTRVILRPRMTITDAARISGAIALHHRAHELCFIARSVNFPVECGPMIEAVRGETITR